MQVKHTSSCIVNTSFFTREAIVSKLAACSAHTLNKFNLSYNKAKHKLNLM
jgi:hypothetical protein